MKYTLTFALMASIIGSAFASLRAPLPEFKNEKQLAEWRAEKAAESSTQSAVENTTFYTGKPYLASSGGFAFKYRSYNPEVARWTSEDPCGFPDGANNMVYAPTPTMGFDALGLFYSGTSYGSEAADKALWITMQGTAGQLALVAMMHAEGHLAGDWTLSASEDSIVKGCADYTGKYFPSVDAILGASPANGAFSTPVNHFRFTKPSDEYYAFGHADLSTSGTVTRPSGPWQYNAVVTLADSYSFSKYAGTAWYTPTAVGYRLESHGFLKPFKISGTWNDIWYE